MYGQATTADIMEDITILGIHHLIMDGEDTTTDIGTDTTKDT
jgi:hypothetical protein